ncbi:hypothetical protein Pan153_03690 [Gimesia panareensis]|uniref:Uncharacterized protein n=1 Tax=Gimesia panareensis TaxID=2527978 RepID=A0A518FHD6_9PLAN|nr:hypothetical protein [Gimesia panareensis]QDV15751.1 hypothetical protein Pan153_03690 [Gimesia panareensis]
MKTGAFRVKDEFGNIHTIEELRDYHDCSTMFGRDQALDSLADLQTSEGERVDTSDGGTFIIQTTNGPVSAVKVE